MRLLRALADRRSAGSLSAWFRRRRSHHLAALLNTIPPPVTILDIGGEPSFWDAFPLSPEIDVVLLNVEHDPRVLSRFRTMTGDARDLPHITDGEFALVVSNSVIEHVGRAHDRAAMAREVRRVGRRYYVQTPNRWFFIDPHFLIPTFHWWPRSLRVWWLTRFDAGWFSATHDRARAEEAVDSVTPLSASEMLRLFPGATLWRERVFGLTKSLIVYAGFDERSSRSRSGSAVGS